jgi:hypothetical protein
MIIETVDVNEVIEHTKLMRTATVLYFPFLLVQVFIVVYYMKRKLCYGSPRARFGVLQCSFRKTIA